MAEYTFKTKDVFKNIKKFISSNFITLGILFLINFTITFLFVKIAVDKIYNNVINLGRNKKPDMQFIFNVIYDEKINILIFILIFVTLLIQAFISSLIKNYILNKNMTLTDHIKYTVRNYFRFVLGHFTLWFVVYIFFVIVVYLTVVPLTFIYSFDALIDGSLYNVIKIVGFIPSIFLIFLLAYFIYAPNVVFIQGNILHLFEDSYDYIKRHYKKSLLLVVTFGVFYYLAFYTQFLFISTLKVNLLFFAVFFFLELYKFYAEILRMSFVTHAYKAYNSITRVPDLLRNIK